MLSLAVLVGLALAVELGARSDSHRPRMAASPPVRRAGDHGLRSAGRPGGVYAAATSTRLNAAVRGFPERVYVPNSGSGTVDVIDPATFKVVGHYRVGAVPHHVTPAWDMKSLYVDDTNSNSLTQIDPRTGKPERTIGVIDPSTSTSRPTARGRSWSRSATDASTPQSALVEADRERADSLARDRSPSTSRRTAIT